MNEAKVIPGPVPGTSGTDEVGSTVGLQVAPDGESEVADLPPRLEGRERGSVGRIHEHTQLNRRAQDTGNTITVAHLLKDFDNASLGIFESRNWYLQPVKHMIDPRPLSSLEVTFQHLNSPSNYLLFPPP